MAQVVLRDIRKSFGEVEVIHGANLDIADGEFVVFVGPSGCGKSTLLRLIAGLEEITSGDLEIAGKRCNELPPSERGIAMVFQSYALYPHMSVYDNMAFALKLARADKKEIAERVQNAAEILQIGDLLDRKPRALSGGQRQRVAIGRAIVRQPEVFLFDEPLSNLDAALRVQMRIQISKLHSDLETTIIYVTHDQVEAMTMADKIVVLNKGKVEQFGAPLTLYNHPENRFVAGFIGSPKMNFLDGTIVSKGPDETVLELAGGSRVRARIDSGRAEAGQPITLGVRPEHLRVVDREPDRSRDAAGVQGAEVRSNGLSTIPGQVALVEHLGEQTLLYVDTEAAAELVVVRVDGISDIEAGESVSMGVHAPACYLFDGDGIAYRRTGVES